MSTQLEVKRVEEGGDLDIVPSSKTDVQVTIAQVTTDITASPQSSVECCTDTIRQIADNWFRTKISPSLFLHDYYDNGRPFHCPDCGHQLSVIHIENNVRDSNLLRTHIYARRT